MKKEIQKQNSHKVATLETTQFMKYLGGVETKTLNTLGKASIVGIYTLAVVLSTAFYFKYKAHEQVNKDLRSEILALKTGQKELHQALANSSDIASMHRSATRVPVDIETRILNQINKKLDATDSYTSKKIEDQKQEIYNLKQKIKDLLLLTQSSPKTFKDQKTMKYSRENYDILYYEHRQVLKRLKEKHTDVEQAYMNLYDMSQDEHQAEFEKLKDRNKLEYYSEKRKLEKVRSQFRKKKFLVIAENN
ncbi:MAG: hypothetical protein CME64_06425 [Halobacteriovoraceae bacterium]|nr:hypothetical protein [Halobacteriovoraceae bacterium]|tara:strand:- start:64845 stop:65591 length:747 start_codon:yes stop_codon:yes gene_type:complete